MKTNIRIIAILAITLAAMTACTKSAPVKDFHLTSAETLSLSYNGGSATFGIEANASDEWTISNSADWIDLYQGFGNGNGISGSGDAAFNIVYGRWTKNEVRTGTITVTGPNGTYTKTLVQNPKPAPNTPYAIKGNIT